MNYTATEVLGTEKFPHSVCTCNYSVKTQNALKVCMDQMATEGKIRVLIGAGHIAAACQGLALGMPVTSHTRLKSTE